MKKILLSFISAFLFFTLSAQVSDNFSDYNIGGKIAQQAQAMGRTYWTTWSNAPGGSEDATVAEIGGKKAGHFFGGGSIDQVLFLGGAPGIDNCKTSGVWGLSFKMWIPTDKAGYFNIQSKSPVNYPGPNNNQWACQFYVGSSNTSQGNPAVLTPGMGSMDCGGFNAATFPFQHDAWTDVKLIMDLDNDHAEIFINDNFIYAWTYTEGTFGSQSTSGGCIKQIDAVNIYPGESFSDFYISDIVFAPALAVLYETGFDDVPNNSYVAQSYPEWWMTWDDNPGTNEDALITDEQSSSQPQSARFSWGTDLVFLAGDKTSGIYTVDFDMYIPNNARAYFNLLNSFDGGNNPQWAVGVYFNVTASGGPVAGTYVRNNEINTNFTFPFDTWFPVSIYVDLDNDVANIRINGTQVLEWQYSIEEEGDDGARQLAAVDFYPPQAGALYYIDNFKFAGGGGDNFPIIDVTPTALSETLTIGGTATKQISVTNSGNSMGNYSSWVEFNFAPQTGSSTFTLTNSTLAPSAGGLGWPNGPHTVELAHKIPATQLCDKLGTKITKLAYYLPAESGGGTSVTKLTFRVYGPYADNAPGELLAEGILNNPTTNTWNEIILTTPVLINKSEYWLSVELIQLDEHYPLGNDNGPLVLNANYTKRNGGTWTPFTQIEYGNWLIKGTAEGGVVDGGCWLSTSGNTYGSIPVGETKTFDAIFNAAGLAEGDYAATIFVATTDTENPLFTIPCTITVIDAAIINVTPTSIDKSIIEGDNTIITIPVTVSNSGSVAGEYETEVEDLSWLTLEGDTEGTVAIGGNKTFNVVIEAGELGAGEYGTVIKITTNDAQHPLFEINCTLTVIAALPVMNVTPTSISENIIEGENAIITVPVTVSNTGTAEGEYEAEVNETVTWLTLEGDTEGVVAADASKTFNAVIDASELEIGEYTAKINITTNDALNPLFEITCTLNKTLDIEIFTINDVQTAIFPNPASDLVNVECNIMMNNIQVINHNGQIVYSATVNNDKTTINTSNLSAGYYFIRINTDKSNHSVKFIVK